MSNENKYYCFNCGSFFGNIPAPGCPCCGSENHIETHKIAGCNEMTFNGIPFSSLPYSQQFLISAAIEDASNQEELFIGSRV